jgi:hypothetical protein
VDAIALLAVDDRPQRDLLGGGVADGQPVRVLGQAGRVRAGDLALHEVPPGGHAHLALVQERTERAH